jgi:hypothetical protein
MKHSVFFGLGLKYDGGAVPCVSLNGARRVVEVHRNQAGAALYSRVGRLNQATIEWGPVRRYDRGTTPSVSLNLNDVVVEVHKASGAHGLWRRMGRVIGDEITWIEKAKYDSGVRPAVSVNEDGLAVEVHETQAATSRDLWCHVWQVEGDRVITLSKRKYGRGSTPKIAINNRRNVVEVHRAGSGLAYRAGRVNGATLELGPSFAFHSSGTRPSVALTDTGEVIVTFESSRGALSQRTGRLSGDRIEWRGEAVGYDEGTDTSVAAAGAMAIEVHEGAILQTLWCCVSLITDRTSWMQNRLATLGRRSLGELVLPASHDAAMYPGPPFSEFAQTQSLSIYGQLCYGIRYFDLRPRWTGRKFVFYHGPSDGPDVSVVLREIRRFALEHHSELVILKFSHFDRIDNEKYAKLVKQIEASLGTWLVKTLPPGKRLVDVTLGEYVVDGPALLVVVDRDYAVHVKEPGFWVYRDWNWTTPEKGDLRVFDQYSNTTSLDSMRKGQLGKFKKFTGRMARDASLRCDLFLLSWTLTPITFVFRFSVQANRRLGSDIRLGQTRPAIPNWRGHIMNLLYADYVEFARLTDVALFHNGERLPEPVKTRRVRLPVVRPPRRIA